MIVDCICILVDLRLGVDGIEEEVLAFFTFELRY